jgi:hypothetical protein
VNRAAGLGVSPSVGHRCQPGITRHLVVPGDPYYSPGEKLWRVKPLAAQPGTVTACPVCGREWIRRRGRWRSAAAGQMQLPSLSHTQVVTLMTPRRWLKRRCPRCRTAVGQLRMAAKGPDGTVILAPCGCQFSVDLR